MAIVSAYLMYIFGTGAIELLNSLRVYVFFDS